MSTEPSAKSDFIRQIVEATEADEIMVTSMVYGRAERRRSYELVAAEWGLSD